MDNQENEGTKKINLKTDKVVGYSLLAIGLVIICWAVFSLYTVLTGKKNPPRVFNVLAPEISLPAVSSEINLPESINLPEGVSLTPSQNQNSTKIKIIPDEVFNGLLNIGMYYLLSMFIASSGAKISSIGIQLLKDIKVQIKEDRFKLQQ